MNRHPLILAAALVAAGALLLASDTRFGIGLAAAVISLTALWLVSLPLRDASIVDIFWGPGCALLGWLYFAVASPRTGLGLAACCLTTVWAARLALHIWVRNAGAGEDYRYRQWREQAGSSFWWVSLARVFWLQAVVMWVVSSPLHVVQGSAVAPSRRWLVAVGVALWLVGFAFEAVSDWQLLAFRRDPANRGRVLSSGLWGLSRHPNYFGEALLWWGIGALAAAAGGALGLIGPTLLTYTLLKISGVAMLDRELVSRRPGYADYLQRTPAFFPIPRALRRRRR